MDISIREQHLLRLELMLQWRLKEGRSPFQQVEASALDWAIEQLTNCTCEG